MPPPSPFDDDLLARRRDLGEQLRTARLARNLTQEQLALATGVDRSSLVRIERGQQDARLSTVLRLARALDAQLVFAPPT